MAVSKILKFTVLELVVALCLAMPSSAQTPAASQPRKAPAPAPPASPQKAPAIKPAPQVVTVVHRLNGLKMFRMLLRSEEDVQAVAQIDEAFKLMDDVHTNVIAGLALEDGETIAALLPDAELEFGPMASAFANSGRLLDSATAGNKATKTKVGSTVQRFEADFRATPELAVIGSDGRRHAARFVGLDGLTGLSILQLVEKKPGADKLAEADKIIVGANLRVLGPELAAQTRALVSGNLFVRMGETKGSVLRVSRAPSGDVAQFRLRAPRFNLGSVGGVAVNDAGQAVGIVSGIEGFDATVLPTTMIQAAAKRVLTQQASVPRPFLGVRGEPLANMRLAEVEGLGWAKERAASLVEDRRGILLTSILPDTPAARAELKAGDVILKVNGEEIQNGDDFSWWLDQAGTSNSVSFTVVSPKSADTQAVDVKLTGALDNRFALTLAQRPTVAQKQFSLLTRGLETIALRPAVAARLGVTAGLLVVYVGPESDAANAGLLAGDVIESIDGRSVVHPSSIRFLSTDPGKTHRIQVVRKKEKLEVVLKNSDN